MAHPDFEELDGRNAIRYYFLERHHKCFDPDDVEFSFRMAFIITRRESDFEPLADPDLDTFCTRRLCHGEKKH